MHPQMSAFGGAPQASVAPQLQPNLADPYFRQRHSQGYQLSPDPVMLSNAAVNGSGRSQTPPDQTLQRKRKRTECNENAGSRVPIACAACRDRKTRCSGDQPSCSYCRKAGIGCVYLQAPGGYVTPHSASNVDFDEWGSKILTAVGQLAEKLESAASNRVALSSAPAPVLATLKSNFLNRSGLQVTRHFHTPVNDIHSIQSILAWKFISIKINPSLRASLLPESRERSERSPRQGHASGSTSKADLMKLRDSFVKYVLPTVPVLSVPRLDGYISHIGENGAEWNSESCLVFLVAALGVANRRHIHDGMENETVEGTSNFQRKPDEAAFWYWNMAKKRLGWALEENGLLAAQCLCLAGIWHLLNYEALSAWKMFQSASLSLASSQQPGCEGIVEKLGGIEDGSLNHHILWICRKYQFKLQPELEMPGNGSIFNQYECPTIEPADDYDHQSAEIALLKISQTILQSCQVISIQPTWQEILNLSSELSQVQRDLEAWHKSLAPTTSFSLSCENGDSSILSQDPRLKALYRSYLEAKELSLRIWTYLSACTDLAHIIHSSGEEFIREHFLTYCCNKASQHLEIVTLRLKAELESHKYAKQFHESYFVIQDCFTLTLLLLGTRNGISHSTTAMAGVNIPKDWAVTVNDVVTFLEAVDKCSRGKQYARVLRLL